MFTGDHSFRGLQFQSGLHDHHRENMAAGRHDVNTVAKSLHPDLQVGGREKELTGNAVDFGNFKSHLSGIPLPRSHFLILPKQFHQLRTTYSDI